MNTTAATAPERSIALYSFVEIDLDVEGFWAKGHVDRSHFRNAIGQSHQWIQPQHIEIKYAWKNPVRSGLAFEYSAEPIEGFQKITIGLLFAPPPSFLED